MKEKMLGSHYPNCTSKKRSFGKSEDISGSIIIKDENLIFEAVVLIFIKSSSLSFAIPLKNIEKVETMNLNGVMPFGVCLFLKDGSECMLGHMRNKKLAAFIEKAIQNNEQNEK